MSRIESAADRGTNRPAHPAARRAFIGHAVRWLRFVGLFEEPCEVRHSHAEEVAAFRTWMCKDRGWSRSTVRSRCSTVDCFFDWMADWGILLESVGFADIDRAVARWHTRGCSRLTIRGYVQHLRTFLRFAEHRGWCAPGLADGIMPPRFHRGEAVPKGLNRDEVLRLLETSEGDRPTDVRDRAILMVLIAYGLRSAEVTRLPARRSGPGWGDAAGVSPEVGTDASLSALARCWAGRSCVMSPRFVPGDRRGRSFLTMTAPIRPLGRGCDLRGRQDTPGSYRRHRKAPWPARAAPCCRPVPARPRPLVQRDRRLPRPPQHLLHCGIRQGATQRAARGSPTSTWRVSYDSPGCGQLPLHHLAPGTRREVRRQCMPLVPVLRPRRRGHRMRRRRRRRRSRLSCRQPSAHPVPFTQVRCPGQLLPLRHQPRACRPFTPSAREDEPRRPRTAPPYVYSRKELRCLFGAIDATRQRSVQLDADTLRTLLLLLYGAGLRLGEAQRLTIGDVDLTDALLTVRDTKFFKTRLVPVAPQLADALRAYSARRQDRPLPKGHRLDLPRQP